MKKSNIMASIVLATSVLASTALIASVTAQDLTVQSSVLEKCQVAFNKEVADKMQAYSRNPTGDHAAVMKEAVYEANGNYHACTLNAFKKSTSGNFMVRFENDEKDVESKEPRFIRKVTHHLYTENK